VTPHRTAASNAVPSATVGAPLSILVIVTGCTPTRSANSDHERFSHYVRKEKILESALSGEPVTALCGKVWVPGRDPEKFPICPMCKEIADAVWGAEGD
jgi:hypothetical protein